MYASAAPHPLVENYITTCTAEPRVTIAINTSASIRHRTLCSRSSSYIAAPLSTLNLYSMLLYDIREQRTKTLPAFPRMSSRIPCTSHNENATPKINVLFDNQHIYQQQHGFPSRTGCWFVFVMFYIIVESIWIICTIHMMNALKLISWDTLCLCFLCAIFALAFFAAPCVIVIMLCVRQILIDYATRTCNVFYIM